MTTYQGGLHCSAMHEPSGATVSTDAPVDNNGRGESFSPTDLVGAALAGCMSTIMGIVAQRKNIVIEGMTVEVGKYMNADPRRIAKLEVTITVPLPANHPDRKLIEQAALTCPVKQSLHPDIEIPIIWNWIG
ncbi:MAG: OsmC family protein [Akkermansia sp.]